MTELLHRLNAWLDTHLSDGDKRTVRGVYQFLIGLTVAVPVIIAALPAGVRHGTLRGADLAQIIGTLLTTTTTAARLINMAEDRGWIPAFLKDTPPTARAVSAARRASKAAKRAERAARAAKRRRAAAARRHPRPHPPPRHGSTKGPEGGSGQADPTRPAP